MNISRIVSFISAFCLAVLCFFWLYIYLFAGRNNVYYKLAKSQDITILIAGDSIGNGIGSSKIENSFPYLLKEHLHNKYGSSVNLINPSMGGNGSYAEYVRVSQLNNNNIDIVIICCGHNDNAQSIGKYYESLIRTIKTKWPHSEIISILQSSQKGDTKIIQTIRTLDKHYNIPIADTIEPFVNGDNGDYLSLAPDGIHPNDKGYEIYAKTIENIIDTRFANRAKKQKKVIFPDPLFPTSLEYAFFHEINTNHLTRTQNTFGCILNIPTNSHIGIDYSVQHGSNFYEVIINNKTFLKKDFYREWKTQHQIIDLTEYYDLRNNGVCEIKLDFKYSNQANSVKSLFISSGTPINQ